MPRPEPDALVAFLEGDLAQIVFGHQLQEVFDRPDVERPGRIPFVVGHRETPKTKHPARPGEEGLV